MAAQVRRHNAELPAELLENPKPAQLGGHRHAVQQDERLRMRRAGTLPHGSSAPSREVHRADPGSRRTGRRTSHHVVLLQNPISTPQYRPLRGQAPVLQDMGCSARIGSFLPAVPPERRRFTELFASCARGIAPPTGTAVHRCGAPTDRNLRTTRLASSSRDS